jgi:hypothetical protein
MLPYKENQFLPAREHENAFFFARMFEQPMIHPLNPAFSGNPKNPRRAKSGAWL